MAYVAHGGHGGCYPVHGWYVPNAHETYFTICIENQGAWFRAQEGGDQEDVSGLA